MRTTFALYESYDQAKAAVDVLLNKDVDKQSINILAQKSAVESAWDVNERTIRADVSDELPVKEHFAQEEQGNRRKAEDDKQRNKDVDTLDGMLGRLQPIRTNLAGELLASGDVAKMLARTAAAPGQAALKDTFKEFGIEDTTAEAYSEGIRNGQFLVFVRSQDEKSGEVKELLNGSKAKNVATFRG